MLTGRLEAIWLKRVHRGVMDAVSEARVTVADGLVGTVDRSRRRQITLLDADAWARATVAAGTVAPPIARRANLLIRGIDLAHTRGRILRIGEVLLAVGGETTPCERMEAVAPGLQLAMRVDWGGGAFARVLYEGVIRVGDEVGWGGS